jgi:hypothetical protein
MYITFTKKLDPALLLNVDETPLHLIPAIGRTWGECGADNGVESSGGKDKGQMTGTPWISFEGEIVFFHTTMKGKTDCCLPSKAFQKRKEFNEPMKILFGHSTNHWVTTETARKLWKRKGSTRKQKYS